MQLINWKTPRATDVGRQRNHNEIFLAVDRDKQTRIPITELSRRVVSISPVVVWVGTLGGEVANQPNSRKQLQQYSDQLAF